VEAEVEELEQPQEPQAAEPVPPVPALQALPPQLLPASRQEQQMDSPNLLAVAQKPPFHPDSHSAPVQEPARSFCIR
jgi:hypothetical protein